MEIFTLNDFTPYGVSAKRNVRNTASFNVRLALVLHVKIDKICALPLFSGLVVAREGWAVCD